MFNNIEFAHPFFLSLLILIPILAYWYVKNRNNNVTALKIPSLKGVTTVESMRVRMLKWLPILRGVALGCFIVALARPQYVQKEDIIEGEGVDIVLSLDISTSMLAQDFDPNRLEAAKQVAQNFVDKRPYDRIGLVIFSGEAFTQCPLTTDHALLKDFISKIQNGIIKSGTAIGAGLAAAVNRLYQSPSKSRVIVLMTDGKNEGDSAFSIEDGINMAQNFGIKVYTIGIGTIGEALVPVGIRPDGQYVFGYGTVEIDKATLQHISQNTGGKYYRATGNKGLGQIYAEIDRLEKSKIEVTSIKKRSEAFGVWLCIGLILILLETITRHTVLRTNP
jgi:Ca-activated chloride channel homolog